MKIAIAITHKLFHNDTSAGIMATVRASISPEGKIAFGKLHVHLAGLDAQPEYVRAAMVPAVIFPILRTRIPEWRADKRYSITWNEDNCIEATFKDVTP